MTRKSRNTIQKELIRDKVKNIKEFFTAEDLYKSIKKKYPEIGLATIYRFMKDLRKTKQIHTYICNKKFLYSNEKRSHCHFICEETGKITHFDIDSLDFLKDKIPGSISSFQIEIKGKCKKCLKS